MSQWFRRRASDPEPSSEPGPILIHVLDGFMSAGASANLAAKALRGPQARVVHEFDLDTIYDYRARRPTIVFHSDHYRDYDRPRLLITEEVDAEGTPFLLLSGPEPDFGWERFTGEVIDIIKAKNVSMTVGLGAVPMGVPHTRPAMITAHGTKPELVDQRNLWSAEITVPSSAQSLLEYRMGQQNLDAIGYVVHVPHYLTQIEYPPAALALLDALSVRLGLSFDLEDLRESQFNAIELIEQQIADQDGEELLSGLEQQYDAFTRGAAKSLLEDDEHLPSGDELANQLEQFLARQRRDDQR